MPFGSENFNSGFLLRGWKERGTNPRNETRRPVLIVFVLQKTICKG
jgi:hypothetical protein